MITKRILLIPMLLFIKVYLVILFMTAMNVALALTNDQYSSQEFPIVINDKQGHHQNIDEFTNLTSKDESELFLVLELYEEYIEKDGLNDIHPATQFSSR